MANVLEYIIKFKDQMSSGLAGVGANVERTFARIDARSRSVQASIQGIGTRLDALQRTRDISLNLRDIRTANREMQRLEAQRDRITGSGLNRGGAGGGLAGLALTAGAGFFVKQSVEQATKQQGLQDAIRFSMGKKDGAGMLDHINATSDKFGLDKMASLEGAKTFLGATSGKLSPADQVKTFDAVSEAITTFKLSGEDAKGVYLALGQIASKGTVSAEELRGQIGERLPGAFSLAAKAMGVSEQALGSMMQKGELAASDFLPKFASELHKTFGVEAIKSSDSAQANFNRLTNSLNDVKNKIGTELLPAMMPFIKALIDVFNWVSANAQPLLILASGITAIVLGYKAWTAAQWLINAAMAANPIGVILVVVGLIITAVTLLVAKFGGVAKTWEALKNTFIQIGEIIKNAFKQYIDNIVSFWEYLFYKVVGFIDRMAQKAMNLGKALKSIGSLDFEGANKYWNMQESSSYDAKASAIKAGWSNRTDERKNNVVGAAANIMKIWQTSSPSPSSSSSPYSFANGAPGGSPGGTGSSDKNKVGSDINGITGGGTRNTYISLGKFYDNITIHVASAKDGIDQIQEMVEDAMLRVLNSAQ